MIRLIWRLHFPCRWPAAAAPQQLDPPPRATDTWLASYRPRRHRGDPPSGYRRVRQGALTRCLLAIAPAPQDKGRDTRMFRGELQPTARYRRKRSDVADDRDDAGSPQTLFHSPQDFCIARRMNQHDAAGIEAMDGETRPIEIPARLTPQHKALTRRGEPSDNIGDKGGGESAVLLVAAEAKNFVQGAKRKPTTRQCSIDCRNAERQDALRRRRCALDMPDALAELSKTGVFRGGPAMPCGPARLNELVQLLWAVLVKRHLARLRHLGRSDL